ncbi:MAG: ATP synthase F1 subunit gamma [Candidatus Paceibacterota bacterium]
MSLKNIKNKIRSIDKTRKVTKAMEAVSAVKMRKSQTRALEGRAYAHSALSILQRLSGSIDGIKHMLSTTRDIKRSLVVIVTSDKGLAGSLNSSVLKRIERLTSEKGLTPEDTSYICVGRKGYEYALRREYTVLESYINIDDEVSLSGLKKITETAVSEFTEGSVDVVYVVYTNFRSTFEQFAEVRTVLPLSLESVRETVAGIVPTKGAFADVSEESDAVHTYTIEPNAEEVLNELLPFLLEIEMYHTFLESKASEHSARMVAMKNASDKAKEMSDGFKLRFNKERQSLITREVSEIIGGIETLTT